MNSLISKSRVLIMHEHRLTKQFDLLSFLTLSYRNMVLDPLHAAEAIVVINSVSGKKLEKKILF